MIEFQIRTYSVGPAGPFARATSIAVFLIVLANCSNESDSVPSTSDHHGGTEAAKSDGSDSAYNVHPGMSIQDALEAAARDPTRKIVRVHSGIYRPSAHGQALLWFNARHDGITLETVGEVVLTAANALIADRSARGYPAVVNHVVYIGDGISRSTILRGFKITGANGFVTRSDRPRAIQEDIPLPQLRKEQFFYTDGGGIKIFGRSYPTIVDVDVYDNYASPCGGGVSVEHRGFKGKSVLFRNCIFRNNRCQVTGSAIDVLRGSSATIENCLFVGNIANTGIDYPGRRGGLEYNKEHGSGALTVFPESMVRVDHCTFTANWNGVDDKGNGNVYRNTIFWMNTAAGGISPGDRYEVDILDGSGVTGCYIKGHIVDLRGTLKEAANVIGAPDPNFDSRYRPRASEYTGIGFQP